MKKPLIFIHIPKTAGSTLKSILERLYKDDEIYKIYPDHKKVPDLSALAKIDLSNEDVSKIKVFLGHMAFGLDACIPEPCTYITVLRKPVPRVISFYSHLLRDETIVFNRLIKERHLDLKDFVSSGITDQTDNHQTRMLSNSFPPFGKCTLDMLEKAKNVLRGQFAVVGLTERFSESLMLMKRIFGWEMPFYLNKNVSSNKPPIDEHTIKTIEKHNELDIELYQYASKLLDEQIAKQDKTFQEEVAAFNLMNTSASELLCALETKDAEIKKLMIQIEDLKDSASWRVTEPLRKAAAALTTKHSKQDD